MEMKKFYETQDEQSIEILGDMLIEMAYIYEDDEIKTALKNKCGMYRFAALAFKKYPEQIRKFLALYEGVPYEDYHCRGFAIFNKFMGALSDTKIKDFLSAQSPQTNADVSGNVTETTEESET